MQKTLRLLALFLIAASCSKNDDDPPKPNAEGYFIGVYGGYGESKWL